jgi:uncharacterized LabA/DUF88 family protein
MKRIAIFVEGSNFKAACDAVGIRPDYTKMKAYFEKEGEVVGAYYFTALPNRDVESNIRKLVDFLQYNGWTAITKEAKSITTDGVTRYKGNMDVDMVVQAFRMCEYISDLILCSGDGDFCAMAEELQTRAVRVTALSVLRRDATNMTDDRLRKTVSRFINLEDIKNHIRLPDQSDLSFTRGNKPFV